MNTLQSETGIWRDVTVPPPEEGWYLVKYDTGHSDKAWYDASSKELRSFTMQSNIISWLETEEIICQER